MAFRITRFIAARSCRQFSTSSVLADRAIIYSSPGDPTTTLSAFTYRPLSPPASGTLNLKFLASPINPADINVIEGVYPSKPASVSLDGKDSPVFIAGNEGLAEVTEVGNDVSGLQKGDWVVMTRPQSGTWASSKNVQPKDVLKVPRATGLTEVHGATMTVLIIPDTVLGRDTDGIKTGQVNPPTAYNMLHDFVDLQEGDWVLQNGANSAVRRFPCVSREFLAHVIYRSAKLSSR